MATALPHGSLVTFVETPAFTLEAIKEAIES